MSTQRLPIPGSDDGSWGTILNNYLEVSHASDGTLNSGVVADAQVGANAAINPSKIAGTAEVRTNKGQPSGYASLNSSGLVPTTQLGTGTASNTNYLRGDGTWVVPAGGVNLDATDSDIAPLGTQSAGHTGQAADAGHVHPTTGLVTTGQVGSANGVAPLDATSKLPTANLPATIPQANLPALVESLSSLTGAVSLTSSDSSVTITPDSTNHTIDLQATSSGGSGGGSGVDVALQAGNGIELTGTNPVTIAEGPMGLNIVAAAGTAQTLLPYVVNQLTGTAGSACTLTFPALSPGIWFTVEYVQPASGSPATITWPSGILWPGGVAPTLTTTNGKTDIFNFWSTEGSVLKGVIVGEAF